MKKKIINIIPLITFMIVVFLFSNEPVEQSDNTSKEVTETIINITNFDNSNDINEERIELLNPRIRKIAHFALYTIGGLCIMLYINTYDLSKRKLITYSMYFIIFYACSDEIHQYFVPGRGMLLSDVLIDSLGGAVGISFFMLLKKLRRNFISNK